MKVKEELTKALTAMEKLKESFNKYRVDWETEKAGLTKRADDAEAALKPVGTNCLETANQRHDFRCLCVSISLCSLSNS